MVSQNCFAKFQNEYSAAFIRSGHCKRLLPVWEEFAAKYNKDGSRYLIAKIDCTSETELCSEHDILGYIFLAFYFKLLFIYNLNRRYPT